MVWFIINCWESLCCSCIPARHETAYEVVAIGAMSMTWCKARNAKPLPQRVYDTASGTAGEVARCLSCCSAQLQLELQ